MGTVQLRRKLFVYAGQRARVKRFGSAVSLGFAEETGAIGSWIYKKEDSLS